MDRRGEGPAMAKRPNRAGSPICHFLSLNSLWRPEFRLVFLTGCVPSAGPPLRGTMAAVHSHCRHHRGAGFRRQVSRTVGELEALASPQGGVGRRLLGGADRRVGGRLPNEQPSLFGKARTLEKLHLFVESLPSISVTPTAGAPAPLFAAAILPGAAAVVSIACPSFPPPQPGAIGGEAGPRRAGVPSCPGYPHTTGVRLR